MRILKNRGPKRTEKKEKKMKKIVSLILAVLMIAALTLSFASCGETGPVAKVIDIALSEENYAFCVGQENTELLTKINEYLAKIKSDGTFDEICNHYFGDGTPVKTASAAEDASKQQLIVATATGFEPFEMVDEAGNFYGIDLEIAAGFAAYLGWEVVYKDMEFKAVVESVQSGKCNIGMAGLTVTEARKQIVTFSDSYYNASQVLVVKGSNTEFDACKTADDVVAILNTKTDKCLIGCQQGTTGELYIDGDNAEGGYGFPGLPATKKAFTYVALAVTAMSNNQIDYVICDNAPANAVVKKMNAN